MTAARLKIETLPAGAIVPAFEVFDATSKNVLDVGMGPFGYILGRNEARTGQRLEGRADGAIRTEIVRPGEPAA